MAVPAAITVVVAVAVVLGVQGSLARLLKAGMAVLESVIAFQARLPCMLQEVEVHVETGRPDWAAAELVGMVIAVVGLAVLGLMVLAVAGVVEITMAMVAMVAAVS